MGLGLRARDCGRVLGCDVRGCGYCLGKEGLRDPSFVVVCSGTVYCLLHMLLRSL